MRTVFWSLTLLPLLACGSKSGGDGLAAGSDAGDSGGNSDGGSEGDSASAPLDELAVVPAATFQMGCTAGQENCYEDEVVHTVTLTHDTQVGVTEVSQEQFLELMGYNPASFSSCSTCPVEDLTWHEAAAYTNARSDVDGLEQCYTCTGTGSAASCVPAMDPYDCDGFRLLTEAEWENAARCGTNLQYAGSNDAAEVAWTSENSKDKTQPVANLAPNACGLYDLSGNVWEWTQDWYDFHGARGDDPAGPATGDDRVLRGGCWYYSVSAARVANRNYASPDENAIRVGFRIARTVQAR
jgi:formylglycine-generating enzyme required for sulfatase activity